MDLSKVLQQLRQDLANLDTAIASLERLKETGRKRGRPPGSTSRPSDSVESTAEAPADVPKRRSRKPKKQASAPGSKTASGPTE
jgi:hypothetical protein